jgi:glycosyltransferase involved in cell wall biosynthesis
MISVVIPCFGSVYARFLPEAVASVQAQTFTDWEVAIAAGIAEGGNDDAYQVAQRLRKEDKRIRIVFVPAILEVGKAEARNVGIRASKGDWIVSLDADDRLCPEYLEAASDFTYGMSCLIAPGFVEFGDRSRTWLPPVPHEGDRMSAEILGGNVFSCASMFAKKAWEEVGGYEPSDLNYEDWDLWLKFYDASALALVTTLQGPYFEHRIHGDADFSGSSAEMNAVWTALLHHRHARRMPLTKEDLFALEHLPELTKEKLRVRALHFPQNQHLKNLARYIGV